MLLCLVLLELSASVSHRSCNLTTSSFVFKEGICDSLSLLSLCHLNLTSEFFKDIMASLALELVNKLVGNVDVHDLTKVPSHKIKVSLSSSLSEFLSVHAWEFLINDELWQSVLCNQNFILLKTWTWFKVMVQ
jgi:hypothetical protein